LLNSNGCGKCKRGKVWLKKKRKGNWSRSGKKEGIENDRHLKK